MCVCGERGRYNPILAPIKTSQPQQQQHICAHTCVHAQDFSVCVQTQINRSAWLRIGRVNTVRTLQKVNNSLRAVIAAVQSHISIWESCPLLHK